MLRLTNAEIVSLVLGQSSSYLIPCARALHVENLGAMAHLA